MTELALTGNKAKILQLLGDGHPPEVVCSAVAVTPSYISQLLSDENFALEVSKLRMAKLTRYSDQDSLYDNMEAKLAKMLDNVLPYLTDPMKIFKILQGINAMKRRSHASNDNILNQQTVVQLSLPTVIKQKFEININSQVIKVGDQSMTTIQAGNLSALVEKMKLKTLPHEVTRNGQTQSSPGVYENSEQKSTA